MPLTRGEYDERCMSLGRFARSPKTDDPDKAEGVYFLYYLDPSSEEPLGVLEKQELLRILTESVNDLPKNERLVLALHHFEELTPKEIAAVLRLDEQRVVKLQNRATSRLRRRLKCAASARYISDGRLAK
jgi:RNA polymerase sigma factor (sigma-70 family)